MPRSILVLTYEFPPSGGGGVQRVSKFVKFLPEAGWSPVVVSGSPVPGRPVDGTLVAEIADVPIVRVPSRHVSSSIARVFALVKPKRAMLQQPASAEDTSADAAPAAVHVPLSIRLARRFVFPDDAALWARGATPAAIALGKQHGVEAVFASGPPFSALVVGARVARRLGVPFVADMRDAWRDNPVAYWPNDRFRRRSLELERWVLERADAVVTAAEPIAEEARDLGAKRVELLLNGYDPTDLPAYRPDAAGPLRLAFMGKVYRSSDPTIFLEGLAAARPTQGSVIVDIVGDYPPSLPDTIRRLGLDDVVRLHGYQPHGKALDIVSHADVALVLIAELPGAEAILTGKLFEYIGMRIPTLVVGPENGAAAALVREVAGGHVVRPDTAEVAAVLRRIAEEKRAGTLPAPMPEAVARYDRRASARALGTLLGEVVSR